MKTARQDIERNRKQVKCKNSSWLGFSSSTLKYGDMFVYRHLLTGDREETRYAKCHGQVRPLSGGHFQILAQVLSDNLQFSYERWINAEMVVEVIPKDRLNQNLANLFLVYEGNQIGKRGIEMEKEIKAVSEPACGGLWCISIRGWYYRVNNANLTFLTKREAEKFIKDNRALLMTKF